MQQSIQRPPQVEQSFAPSFPATPCDAFDLWATHPDERIAQAGATLRAHWCKEAMSHPQVAPLVSFIKRAWREHFPDGATAGSAWYDMAMLARYLRELEAKIAELEGARHE